MMWADGPLCAFDVETTSADPLTARIVTASVVLIRPGQDALHRDWTVAVDEEIPAEAAAIHGITTEQARRDGQPLDEVITDVSLALVRAWDGGVAVAAFNGCYDFTVLMCERTRLRWPQMGVGPVVDPLVIDRAVDRYRRGSRKLGDMCAHYGIPLENAHTSSADALATARLAWKLAKIYPEVGGAPLAELHRMQADWHAEWAAGYQRYLRGKGETDAVIDGSWPMRRGER